MVLSEENHIQTINFYTRQDWKPLFDLISQIESIPNFDHSESIEINNKDSVVHIPHVKEVSIVREFRKVVYEIPIMIGFDWGAWDEGRRMVNGSAFDFDSVDIPTKCKLITAIVRNDRFCEGALIDAFESGLILEILKSLKKQVVSS